MTTERKDEWEQQLMLYQEFLQFAPRDPGRLAHGLVGWTDGVGVELCAYCAGRIMARGCHLQGPCKSHWATDPDAGDRIKTCDLCRKSVRYPPMPREGGGDGPDNEGL